MPITVAEALIEALPYVQRWAGTTVVVKLGGSTMTEPALGDAVARDLVLLRAVGIDVILVHGGGGAVSDMGRKLGIEPRFVDGLRVTDDETMRVAQMVQVGGISRDFLAAIARFGGRAIGLSGHDGGGWMRAKIREHVSNETGEKVDLGRVGDICSVDTASIEAMMRASVIPVIAPVAVDDVLRALNVNADSVATAIAAELKAARLLLMTDVEGIHGPDGFQSQVEEETLKQWIVDGVVHGGMLPKAEACLKALDGGVERVSIVNGKAPHSLLIELLTDSGSGTMVYRD